MASADKDATGDVTDAMASANILDLETAQRARDAGWVERETYNYAAYNAAPNAAPNAASNSAFNAGGTKGGEATEQTQDVPSWASNSARYEWSDEYGDVGPPHPELEKHLFKNEFLNRTGLKFNNLAEIGVTFESEIKIQPVKTFEDAGLHPVMLSNIELCGYNVPTPIQAYCLPSILTGHDIIAVAQTGSGKTAAFLIPTLSKLMGKAKKLAAPRPNLTTVFNPLTDGVRAEPLILVVAPTRELSTQIFDEARRLCYRSMLRPCVAYGGAPSREQKDELRKGCDVLIATPGRLIDFMEQPNLLSLSRVKYTIIDEADEMVGSDWLNEMKKIMTGGDNNEDADHLFMMFSATFPKDARVVAKEYMAANHIRIRVGRTGSTHANVNQNVVFVEEAKKRDALSDLLLAMPPSRTIVFVNNKRQADFIDDYLYNKGLPSTSIHSDRTQREREDALRAFKNGNAPILVATGVSARGLDIKNVMHVINFDLPNTQYGGIQEYVHRIGRTARIGNEGLATSFYNDRNEDLAESLVKLLLETKQDIPDFLSRFVPKDPTKLEFDDDTDNEGEENAAPAAAVGGTASNAAPVAADAWGAPAAAAPVAANTWGPSSAAPAPAADAWEPNPQSAPTAPW
ncbi:MAG: DEAD DEAH box RNA helicase [Lasallia pustulata]|uniref:RNA helicase n=1 Tax=Lasallia pustulata TaxID=136370 RepID=A0A5M8PFS2_9LECA|nr:MAG: DEAD DEAH box RNA helicase [Lasallia pustulata]